MRRIKFNNKPTFLDGYRFMSKLEATRYGELKLLLSAGEIRELEVHPRYPMFIGAHHICTYEADFSYLDNRGTTHVEDTKGVRTALFILKKKLMKALCNIEVEEVRGKK